jgi:hypothetical protein
MAMGDRAHDTYGQRLLSRRSAGVVVVLARDEDELVRELSRLADVVVLEPGAARLRWESHGQATWPDGPLSGVLVRALPSMPRIAGSETDADYLALEQATALLGWLRALPCPVWNRPRPLVSYRQPNLYRHAPQFARAGLRLPRVEVTASGARLVAPAEDPCRVFVAGPEACDGEGRDLPPSLADRYCALAASLELPFVELRAVEDLVLEINDFPDVAGTAPALCRRLAEAVAGTLAGVPA